MKERRRARRRPRARRFKTRPHDMFEETDYDFPDEYDVEDWMLADTLEGTKA